MQPRRVVAPHVGAGDLQPYTGAELNSLRFGMNPRDATGEVDAAAPRSKRQREGTAARKTIELFFDSAVPSRRLVFLSFVHAMYQQAYALFRSIAQLAASG
jgi:hypothetical protein